MASFQKFLHKVSRLKKVQQAYLHSIEFVLLKWDTKGGTFGGTIHPKNILYGIALVHTV